jgi:hypothetical protein
MAALAGATVSAGTAELRIAHLRVAGRTEGLVSDAGRDCCR